jgi:hypothetical protein
MLDLHSDQDEDSGPELGASESELQEWRNNATRLVMENLDKRQAEEAERKAETERKYAEAERARRIVEYKAHEARFVKNFMKDYPGQEPPDFWDPYNNVKEYIRHDQDKRRGIFEAHDVFTQDESIDSEHSEFAKR